MRHKAALAAFFRQVLHVLLLKLGIFGRHRADRNSLAVFEGKQRLLGAGVGGAHIDGGVRFGGSGRSGDFHVAIGLKREVEPVEVWRVGEQRVEAVEQLVDGFLLALQAELLYQPFGLQGVEGRQ